MEYSWLFPYKEIEKNSKIILYGAGKVGTSFFEQIEDTGYCYVVRWVDANYSSIKKSIEVSNPEDIRTLDVEYDYVVVALLSKELCNDVSDYLVSIGVDIYKIWTPYLIDSNSFLFRKNVKEKQEKYSNNDVAILVDTLGKRDWKTRNIIYLINVIRKKTDISVYSLDENERLASKNYCLEIGLDTNIRKERLECLDSYHIIIVTSTKTAQIAQKRMNAEIICFFQDYEPFYYPRNNDYYRCESIFKNDYLFLCMGEWCANKIKQKTNGRVDNICFITDYNSFIKQRYKTTNKKSILVYCNYKETNNCFDIVLDALKAIQNELLDVDLCIFGQEFFDSGRYDIKIRNYGLLEDSEQRAQVFTDSTLAIVCTGNNSPSYAYEMMLCGCPIIDINDVDSLNKYGNSTENAILVEPNSEIIAKTIINIIEDEKQLKFKSEEAKKWAKKAIMSREEIEEYLFSLIMEKKDN